MMYVPMCPVCNENEVGSLPGGTEYFCSATCEGIAQTEEAEYLTAGSAAHWYNDDDGEPRGSHDLSDDAEALASAGWGTDEDYGYYGEDF